MNMLYNPADPTGALESLRQNQLEEARHLQQAANSWHAYAKKLEAKCVELRSGYDAMTDLAQELVAEANNEKPKRLSINKQLRAEFRAKAKRLSEAKLIGCDPLTF